MIRGSYLVAFDGTHASGKTTLIYSVAAQLKLSGIICKVLPEPARNSPLVDDVVLRDLGNFDLPLELDLVATHISQCIRATRDCSVILSDRTPINVLAYTNLLINLTDEKEAQLLDTTTLFINNWLFYYDIVFYCQDYFSQNQKDDKMRSKVIAIQSEVDKNTRSLYKSAHVDLKFIPLGLSLKKRTSWVIPIIQKMMNTKD